MNLVIYHLRKDEAAEAQLLRLLDFADLCEAFALIKDLEPSVPRE